MIGRSIGHYEILAELGAGGMGTVFKARDTRLRRSVAIKILAQRYNSDNDKARFLREAQAASALNHPNIVTVFDIGHFEDKPYMVMEFAEGHPLGRLIPPRGMVFREAHSYAVQLADALGAAHSRGVIHRDLKPNNIIVSPSGKVKVLDFGLAKFIDSREADMTVSGVFLGTVGYVSPEQAMGRELEPRSDIFSLGVVFHEMLTGAPPFAGPTQWAIIAAAAYDKPQSIRVTHSYIPESIDSLVQKMLAKEVGDRPSTAAVLQALNGISDHSLAAVSSDSPTVVANSSEPVRRTTSRPVSRPSQRAPELASIAVLPFRALSGEKEDTEIVEGIAAELVRALAGVPNISVASPLPLLGLKSGDTGVSELAKSLKIRYVLTGTMRRSGNRIRVIAELDDIMSGLQLWSQSYDRIIDDFFAVQEELAHMMVAAVSGQLIRVRAQQASVMPDDAADAMVQVRRVYHTLNTSYHPEGMFEAVGVLRNVVQLNPGFALAHAFLGFFLSQLFVNNISSNTEADRGEALQSAQMALQLAPGDPEVQENCGIVLFHCGRHVQAEQALRRSVELASVNLVAWGYLALLLGWSGESELQVAEAHSIIDRILKTAPDHPSLPYWIYFKAGIYARQGLNQQALELCARSVSLQPRFPVSLIEYANALGMAGCIDEARNHAAQVSVMNPRASQEAYMRELLITTGSPDRAQTHIAGLIAAGIFQGDLPWPVLSKLDPPSVRATSV